MFVYSQTHAKRQNAFTLVELMAVVAIILILLGGAAVVFMNGRESIKVRSDANHLISFMKSMLDYTKATGVPLVIQFDSEDRSFQYVDPRNQIKKKAKLESKARVLAVKLNERLFHPENLMDNGVLAANSESYVTPPDASAPDGFGNSETTIYVSEGRGLITMAMLLAVQDEDENITDAILTRLNLISGKGEIFMLNPSEVQQFFEEAEQSSRENP